MILTGLSGSVKGYNDKYVKIAKNINSKFNCSVLVASVPQSCWDSPKQVFTEAVDCVFRNIKPKKFFVAGSSAGATIALWYAYLFAEINKVLAVNPVLNLNYHNAKSGLENFAGEKMFIVSGEFDGSAQWLKFLPEKQNVSKNIFAGADHNFKGLVEEFIALHELLFE